MKKITIFLSLLFTFTVKGKVQVTWMGVAGLYITDGETSFFIDPFVSRPSLFKLLTNQDFISDPKKVDHWLKLLRPKNVKAILISESHFDHSLVAPNFAKKTGAILMGSSSTQNIGLGAGLAIKQTDIVPYNEIRTIGKFKVTFLKSHHTPIFMSYQIFSGVIDKPLKQPAKGHEYKMGGHYSYLIEHPEANLVTHTTPVDDLSKWKYKHIKIDAMFMAMATRKDTRRVLNKVVAPVSPKKLYPFHWDNFFAPLPLNYEELKPTFIMQLPELFETAKKMAVNYPIILPKLSKSITIRAQEGDSLEMKSSSLLK